MDINTLMNELRYTSDISDKLSLIKDNLNIIETIAHLFDLLKCFNDESNKLTVYKLKHYIVQSIDDFMNAIIEVRPALGISNDTFDMILENGFVMYSQEIDVS